MLLGALLGLIVPGLHAVPPALIIILLATLIYLACFKLELSSFKSISISRIAFFIAARFVLLPLGVFFTVDRIWPDYSLAAFVLSAMPAGVSAPAFSGMFGGSVAVALAIVVATNAMSPVVVPSLLIATGYDRSVHIDTISIFETLAASIFCPIILFLLTRRTRTLTEFISHNGRALSVTLVSVIIFLAIGTRRAEFIAAPHLLPEQLFLSACIFLLLFGAGWIFCRNGSLDERIATSLCSGCNNAALGISIAVLYFPPRVGMFLVVSEIPWLFGPIAFRKFLHWRAGK